MKPEPVIYQNRIVIFLDVLGFQNELIAFENEAKESVRSNNHAISKKANKFVAIVRDVVTLISNDIYKYYLFSDNICITIDPQQNKSVWVDIFFTLGDLFKKFAQIGYFLRGGIDYGLMLDEDVIAVGIPLVNSYNLERKTAFYPRVVISEEYIKQLKNLEVNGDLSSDELTRKDYFLSNTCEVVYLNPFYNVIKDEDKIGFFGMYSSAINMNLDNFKEQEYIYMKYKWLAEQFNLFLGLYIDNFEEIEGYTLESSKMKKLKKLYITRSK